MYCRRYNKSCIQNNYDENMINRVCENCGTTADYYVSNDNDTIGMNMDSKLSCNFDDEEALFPENPVLAQSYVPIQKLNKTFKPCVGLKMGTIFPELVSPYYPCQSMEEIAFINAMNEVKEGCNKC